MCPYRSTLCLRAVAIGRGLMSPNKEMSLKDYKWITYFMVGSVAVGVAVTVGVLVAYGMNLGAISSSAADWGNFGSVLSGAFTLLGSVTTFGTLVFLLIQQRRNEENQRAQETQRQEAQDKHDKVISRQLEAQTFEQYLKHREVFFDRLESLEATFNHTVRFTNKDALYQSIFLVTAPLIAAMTSICRPIRAGSGIGPVARESA